ncbi:2-polyprenyl-6-hydroxyphenyl methylase/3-demethylubiquinone-9 3-methyltransferase [Paraburkholderia bannensis]|uniref:2-polyprenyl-6-hydroxyphenyl methylase/3-demethylubiquinone-9 3-methyltransferase n=1 Tax=Paraburkholderia bannensis TaxID=765414 RepID=A0A7W9WQV4_9BURK|nr:MULTISPECIES: class I SAM-dependent methyltransferase [Paraburkholderia]MBB3257482.1 2-polyprenyl-6-hydroxyphenyl methylase/3-demethylubiquinone-9 3-methyltransferase [Paraburkholderia sp. WP4_3_2]MBB6102495.1 2-polyprenyl-6-hydroxyphenyl methylase/3-demethylubiquinone-9 3-methyltransferase [Paraburkholderia bannensis]
MPTDTHADQPSTPELPGRAAYTQFADRYAQMAPEKPHNALYERPATAALLGDVAGLSVLDAGCGPGIVSAELARAGAQVKAFDVTPAMVELARSRCADLNVEIAQGDLGQPLAWLADAQFDRIVCSLALDYVERLAPTFAEFHRVARPGARLVFSMAHPMRDWIDTRTRGNRPYFDTTRFGLHWGGFGEPKPYVEAYRRPLADIVNALLETGWQIDGMLEPKPAPEMKAVAPALYNELALAPAFLCIRARRD